MLQLSIVFQFPTILDSIFNGTVNITIYRSEGLGGGGSVTTLLSQIKKQPDRPTMGLFVH